MALSVQNTPDDSYAEPEIADYTSNILRLFVESLNQRQEVQVLDVGPVCSQNISCLAHRAKRLYVCDMFLRLDRERRIGKTPNTTWRNLDYPPRSFDGVLLWDLPDRLEDGELVKLVKLCHNLTRSRGMVMVIVHSEHLLSPPVNSFVITDEFRLHLRPQPHLTLPLHVRANRKVLDMLAPFIPVKSYIYRNGLKEFLFRRG